MTHTIDLTSLGLIRITGDGAKKLLQGQLTCNLDDITVTQSRLAAHCNPQGRIISLFRLFFWNECYFLLMPAELITIGMAALKKYAVFFKVTIEDVTAEFSRVGLIEAKTAELPQQIDEQVTQNDMVIIKLPGQVTRHLLVGSNIAIQTATSQLNATAATIDQWHTLEIQADLPAIYPETSEKFLPHELNLPALNAVSFNKGCYTGQEIIARMHYRGKLKTSLKHAKVNTIQTIQRGNDIYYADKPVGSIVDFAATGYNNFELLIVTQANDQQDKLTLDREAHIILE